MDKHILVLIFFSQNSKKIFNESLREKGQNLNILVIYGLNVGFRHTQLSFTKLERLFFKVFVLKTKKNQINTLFHALEHSHAHAHTRAQMIVPVVSRFDSPEAEREQHFLERPLLAEWGNERVQQRALEGKP